jgi:hypothetical protein
VPGWWPVVLGGAMCRCHPMHLCVRRSHELVMADFSLDNIFKQQLSRVRATLDRVDAGIEARRRAGLSAAYEEAESLKRLAQIAQNCGRVTLPGLDVYDSKANGLPTGVGHTGAVDSEAAFRRSHVVAWAPSRRWRPRPTKRWATERPACRD